MDSIAEFINTELNYTQLLAGHPMVVNGSTETAVVKDILIEPILKHEHELVLKVGAMAVARAFGFTHLSGNELIGESTTLKIHIAREFEAQLNKFFTATNTSASVYEYTMGTVFGAEGQPSYSNRINHVISDYPLFHCIAPNGDYYYYVQGSANISRRAGGITGALTNHATGLPANSHYNFCYDGERYIYCTSSSTLSIFDTQTNTSITRAISGGVSAIAQSQASVLDGYMLVRGYVSDTYLTLVNIATGNRTIINLPTPTPTGSVNVVYFSGLGKDDNGDYIAFITNDTLPYLRWYNLGPDLANPKTFKASGSGVGPDGMDLGATFARSTGLTTLSNICARRVGSTHLFMASTSNNTWVFDINTKILRSITPASGTVPSGTTTALFYPMVDNSQANDEFGLVRVRATGIKTI